MVDLIPGLVVAAGLFAHPGAALLRPDRSSGVGAMTLLPYLP